jgi:hypothetical protein
MRDFLPPTLACPSIPPPPPQFRRQIAQIQVGLQCYLLLLVISADPAVTLFKLKNLDSDSDQSRDNLCRHESTMLEACQG